MSDDTMSDPQSVKKTRTMLSKDSHTSRMCMEETEIKGFRDLARQVDEVPELPGCYLWKDAKGRVIYVGKAKKLKTRMNQYIHITDDRPKIPRMMMEVASFDYVVVENEHEALVLERNLINQYQPYYNVDFKDDKSYPYIALTQDSVFPAIKYTREKHSSKTLYFGPYTDARAARETIEVLRKLVPICSAACPVWKKLDRNFRKHTENTSIAQLVSLQAKKACFDFHVGKAPGVCVGAISPEAYAKHVGLVCDFLRGRRSVIYQKLQERMQEEAGNLEFEQAQRTKQKLSILSSLNDSQQVVFSSNVSADVVGLYREETISAICLFCVREGRVIRTSDFIIHKGLEIEDVVLIESFVTSLYDTQADIPRELIVGISSSEGLRLDEYLRERDYGNIRVHVAYRGEKRKLLDTVEKNAHHALVRYMVKTGYSDDRTNRALLELENALALPHPPHRIECFDISTLHGYFTVASMVVFIDGKPAKHLYRHFKIRTPLTEANDFVSMAEVLQRRYSPENLEDPKFGPLPDLLVLDGGKPQLTAALQQFETMGIQPFLCGLAKSDEEVFVPWDTTPIVLPSGSASLYLIKYVRDESHRFAITFHRYLRDKAQTKSILDEIEGVGPARKKALMAYFGSMKALRMASVQEIAKVRGVSQNLAQLIWETLQTW